MSNIQYGSQLYTWQMSGEKYLGKMPHMLDIIRKAGFRGIEPDVPIMMGKYYESTNRTKELLEQESLELGALCIPGDWRNPKENEKERWLSDKTLEFLQDFPNSHLMLSHNDGEDRSDLIVRQQNCLACINSIAKRANDMGISCSVHVNSEIGSVFRTEEDYKILLDGLDTSVIGWCPDSGHIVNGGMDVYTIFQEYISVIKHLHFKDITSEGIWAPMGKGITDFPRLIKMLQDNNFDGWVMIEEESPNAEKNPDAATLINGKYLVDTLLPLGP